MRIFSIFLSRKLLSLPASWLLLSPRTCLQISGTIFVLLVIGTAVPVHTPYLPLSVYFYPLHQVHMSRRRGKTAPALRPTPVYRLSIHRGFFLVVVFPCFGACARIFLYSRYAPCGFSYQSLNVITVASLRSPIFFIFYSLLCLRLPSDTLPYLLRLLSIWYCLCHLVSQKPIYIGHGADDSSTLFWLHVYKVSRNASCLYLVPFFSSGVYSISYFLRLAMTASCVILFIFSVSVFPRCRLVISRSLTISSYLSFTC